MSNKFNFNTYFKSAKKDNTDSHLEKMLSEQHKAVPNAITEKQLAKKDHANSEPNAITEKQLKSVRVGDEGLSTEGRLNKDKARFNIKHRNKEAYTGNINKVEAKRISGDKTEDEKYEAASSVPKGMRWWEKEAKIASLKAELKKLSARDYADTGLTDESKRWEGVSELGDTLETGVIDKDPGNEFVGSPDMVEEEGDDDAIGSRNLMIADKQEKEVAGLYTLMLKVSYDPSAWVDDLGDLDIEALKEESLNKIIRLRPDLEGKVMADDIGDAPSKTKDGAPCVVFRVVGDEYRPTSATDQFKDQFKELAYKQDSVDGTPVTKGVVKILDLDSYLDSATQEIDSTFIAEEVVLFLNSKHPELNINADSIQVDAERSVASFIVDTISSSGETPAEFPVNDDVTAVEPINPAQDFPIEDDLSGIDTFR